MLSQRDNRINLAISRDNVMLTKSSLQMARMAKADSSAMKTLAIVSTLFLPGTFFSVRSQCSPLQLIYADMNRRSSQCPCSTGTLHLSKQSSAIDSGSIGHSQFRSHSWCLSGFTYLSSSMLVVTQLPQTPQACRTTLQQISDRERLLFRSSSDDSKVVRMRPKMI
jgi:hypothetical protein